MSAVATAVVGSAVVSGYMGSKAADKAAKASAKGADAAAQVQWDMYDRSRQDQLPWLGTGQNALKMLAALNGVPYAETNAPAGEISRENFDENAYLEMYPELRNQKVWDTTNKDYYDHYQASIAAGDNRKFAYKVAPTSGVSAQSQSPDYSAFYDSPDYQFAFSEGNRAVNAGLAARGLSNSGRAMKELTRYGQGAASQQLNTYRNALAAMAGVGQSTATNLGNLGANTATNIGQARQNSADARASGYLGRANAWSSAINQGVGAGAYLYGGKTA